MVSRTATFRFFLDIRDFITKGRVVVRTTNQMGAGANQAGASMDRMGASTARAGQQSAQAAINFQTATQGMLNLSTAGIQTFTSFSNLDRAGNRLAQSQIGVARATDLLTAKELRLQQLREKSGDLRKIIQLEQEIGTARADLIVKTDKLKIEESALFDIQLLFIANIANVMISSLQTIISLKNAHILATFRQIISEKLLARAFVTTSVSMAGSSSALAGMSAATVTATITARGLLIALGPIALILGAASLAIIAYQENWLGFGDAVKKVLPFLEDKKDLLRDVNAILGETGGSWKELTGVVSAETKKQSALVEHWKTVMHENALEVSKDLQSVLSVTSGGQQANPSKATLVGGGKFGSNLILGAATLNIFSLTNIAGKGKTSGNVMQGILMGALFHRSTEEGIKRVHTILQQDTEKQPGKGIQQGNLFVGNPATDFNRGLNRFDPIDKFQFVNLDPNKGIRGDAKDFAFKTGGLSRVEQDTKDKEQILLNLWGLGNEASPEAGSLSKKIAELRGRVFADPLGFKDPSLPFELRKAVDQKVFLLTQLAIIEKKVK